jgi:multiple sugar transport system substrate-binding protein
METKGVVLLSIDHYTNFTGPFQPILNPNLFDKIKEERMSTRNKVSRREFLKVAGLTTAGATLASCAKATPAPATSAPGTSAPATSVPATSVPATSAPAGPVKLTVAIATGEYSDDQLKDFVTRNPNIQLDRVDADRTKIEAMFAAGNPPDIIRDSGAGYQPWALRGLLLDLTPYFNASKILKPDDIVSQPAQYFKLNGGWYGMHKDWSPDQSTFINTDAFAEAGLTVPDYKTHMVPFTEAADWAKKLTKKSGARTVRMGWGYSNYWDAAVQLVAFEDGKKVYSDDFSKIIIKDNPNVVDFLKLMAQLSLDGYVFSTLNPDPNWNGDDMTKNLCGFISTGYWFHGMVVGMDPTVLAPEKIMMLPGLSWGGKVIVNPSDGGAGLFISKASKNPDAAWTWYEDYNGGQPAIDRAKSGWGVPALKSMFQYIPQATNVDKQFYEVLNWEIQNDNMTPVQVNPYYSRDVFSNSWNSGLDQYLKGTMTFDAVIDKLEADCNKAISDGMAASK